MFANNCYYWVELKQFYQEKKVIHTASACSTLQSLVRKPKWVTEAADKQLPFWGVLFFLGLWWMTQMNTHPLRVCLHCHAGLDSEVKTSWLSPLSMLWLPGQSGCGGMNCNPQRRGRMGWCMPKTQLGQSAGASSPQHQTTASPKQNLSAGPVVWMSGPRDDTYCSTSVFNRC